MVELNRKLKPCPFCGSAVGITNCSFGVMGVISCGNCRTKFVIPWNEAESPKDLAEAWNRRAENGT